MLGAIAEASASSLGSRTAAAAGVAAAAHQQRKPKSAGGGGRGVDDQLTAVSSVAQLAAEGLDGGGNNNGNEDEQGSHGSVTSHHRARRQHSQRAASANCRALRHQGSGQSTASCATSVATSAALSTSTAAGRRHYTRQHSFGSEGSGQTLASVGSRYTGIASSVASSHRSRRGPPTSSLWRRKRANKAPPKPQPGRVARALREWGGQDDWVSKVLLRHALATAIQARWRGYITRKKLKEGPEAFFEAEQRKAEHQQAEERRRTALEKELARRRRVGIVVSGSVAGGGYGASSSMAAGRRGSSATDGPSSSFKAAVLGANANSRRTASAHHSAPGGGSKPGNPRATQQDRLESDAASDSTEGWSDIELEDVAAVKLRAITPPWQLTGGEQRRGRRPGSVPAAAASKVMHTWGAAPPQRQQGAGLQLSSPGAMTGAMTGARRLRGGSTIAGSAAVAAGASAGVGAVTLPLLSRAGPPPSEAPSYRLQHLRRRRWQRPPESAVLTPGVVAASKAAAEAGASTGGATAIGGGGDSGAGLQAGGQQLLPRDVVDRLLLPRYAARYDKLGFPERAPGRWKLQQMMMMAGVEGWGDAEPERGAEGGPAGQEVPQPPQQVQEVLQQQGVVVVESGPTIAAGGGAGVTPAA